MLAGLTQADLARAAGCHPRSVRYWENTLELGKDAEHLKHGLSSRCGCVQALLVQKQIHLEGVQLGQEGNKILQAAAEPIDVPGHDDIEISTCSGFMQGIKGWALVSALCATDAVVLVDLGDLPACAFRGLPELAFLIGRGLVESADAKMMGPH
jgi:hypothetical protein